MAYWVLHESGPEDGEGTLHAELFDEWLEAFLYSKVQQADRGRDPDICEAYTCGIPDCGTVPEWGREYCVDCRPGE